MGAMIPTARSSNPIDATERRRDARRNPTTCRAVFTGKCYAVMRERWRILSRVRTFANSRLVLDVARKQLDALDDKIGAFFDGQADAVSIHYEDEGWNVLRFDGLTDPPVEWTIEFGQIASGIREALDYLVYTLSEEGGGNPADPKAKTQWPIFTERTNYPKWRERMLRGVRDPERAVIDWFQPFDRPSDPLAVLDRLTNDKKHREPPPVFMLTTPAEFVVARNDAGPLGRVEIRMAAQPGVPLESNTEIGRTRALDDPAHEVYVRYGANVGVGFGASRLGPDALRNIRTNVVFIVDRFEAFRPFPPTP